jgi:hypothetical protein
MSTGTIPKGPSSELIESRIDKAIAANLSVDSGLVRFNNLGDVMEFAKMMAISGQAVPPHLRNQIGFCFSVCVYALEWRFSPFAVANKTYVVNDRLCFESQLIHAVIQQRAPLIGYLQHSFAGEGGKRTCTVWANIRGLDEPKKYTSPPIESILPKNSPLWKTKPDLQLFYNTTRDWARMHFPDVIMGVYTDSEMEDHKGDTTLVDSPAFETVDSAPTTATEKLMQHMIAAAEAKQESASSGLTDDEKEAILKAEATQS